MRSFWVVLKDKVMSTIVKRKAGQKHRVRKERQKVRVGLSEEITVSKGVCTGEQHLRRQTIKTMELREGMGRVPS